MLREMSVQSQLTMIFLVHVLHLKPMHPIFPRTWSGSDSTIESASHKKARFETLISTDLAKYLILKEYDILVSWYLITIATMLCY